MDNFIFEYPVKQYFGKGCAEEAIKTELKTAGKNVLLGCGARRDGWSRPLPLGAPRPMIFK